MDTVRNILKQYDYGITSMREIGRICGCSKNTASTIITVAQSKGITFEIAKSIKDDELKYIFYPNNNPYRMIPEPDLEYIDKELKSKHVTMKMLHEEYLFEHPHGLRYTQFCERYREYIQSRKISMHIERKAGESMEIDWSGDQVNIFDPETGEVTKASLLVTTIGRSGYPYVEAFLSKELPNYVTGVSNALTYYRGVPKIFVPDNDKSAVIKAHKYDPVINKTFLEMADYYGVAVIPARVRSPKDKPYVEKAVYDFAEREILGRLRNTKFYSLQELNSQIMKSLKDFSSKKFQKKDGSRLSVFMEEDLPKLGPLPQKPYEVTTFKVATVNIDYHISFEFNHYSVPFKYVKQKVELRIKRRTIEIIHNNERIAIHERIHGKRNKYSTQPNHMPAEHAYCAGLNKKFFQDWAKKINLDVLSVVDEIINSRSIEQQGYRACMGLQGLHRKDPETFIEACKQACEYNAKSYKHVNQFIQKIIKDREQAIFEEETIIKHDNIRGIKYYQTTLNNLNEGVQR